MPARAETISAMLAGGDRRAIGRANEVAALVKQRPRRAESLIQCLWDADVLVCMRAADALEKLSRDRAEILQPYKTLLLGLAAETPQQEVRWHLALALPRLRLAADECQQLADILQNYLRDRSSLVKTFAMQGLWDLARQHLPLRPRVLSLVEALTKTGSPAMRARGRLLLREFYQAISEGKNSATKSS